MGDVVNLNQFRKRRDRASKAKQRVANRARTGRTKAERQATQAEASRGEVTLDGKQIDRERDEPKGSGEPVPQGD